MSLLLYLSRKPCFREGSTPGSVCLPCRYPGMQRRPQRESQKHSRGHSRNAATAESCICGTCGFAGGLQAQQLPSVLGLAWSCLVSLVCIVNNFTFAWELTPLSLHLNMRWFLHFSLFLLLCFSFPLFRLFASFLSCLNWRFLCRLRMENDKG